MKEYFKVKDIDVPLYGGKLVIILTNSITKLQKHIPQFTRDDVWAHALYIEYNNQHGYTMILNFNNDNAPVVHSTIAHEATHLANMIAEQVGIILESENDEPYAYIVGWIVDETYKFINKEKFKVK